MKKTLLSGILVLTAFASNAQIPTNGLVANYSFNNGNANDEAGSNHGTVNGATLTEDRFGNTNKAYEFDGSSNIDLGDAPEFRFGTGDFSISLWVNFTNTQFGYIIGKRRFGGAFDQYAILVGNEFVNGGGKILSSYLRTAPDVSIRHIASPTASNPDWHHVVLTHKYDTTAFYIDGTLVGLYTSPNFDGSLDVTGLPLVLGASSATSNEAFTGKIDDVRIYNRFLDTTEIDELYNEPTPTEPIVYIPDTNFKNYLLGNSSINTVNDGEISYAEAAAFTGLISCSSMSITDLTGIEAFVNITGLICQTNQITSLDLSQNTALTYLWCGGNQLASLDVSQNIALTQLTFSFNQLTSLNVANGNNENITWLKTDNNPNLTCIQVDDATYSTTNWIGGNFVFNSGVTFSENCSLGIGGVWNTELIEVYPNPASTVLNISFNTGETTAIKIVNVLGETVISTSINNQNNSIDVSGLTKGVYFVQSATSTGSVPVVKFVKE